MPDLLLCWEAEAEAAEASRSQCSVEGLAAAADCCCMILESMYLPLLLCRCSSPPVAATPAHCAPRRNSGTQTSTARAACLAPGSRTSLVDLLSNTMSKRPPDDQGDESKEENKKPRVQKQAEGEKPCCPICDEEWEAEESPSAAVASHVPRMLSCFHSFCTSCVATMKILQQDKEG